MLTKLSMNGISTISGQGRASCSERRAAASFSWTAASSSRRSGDFLGSLCFRYPMARILIVHGVGYQFSGEHQVHQAYAPGLLDGLGLAGTSLASSEIAAA